jgi:hypothetical protein
MTAEIFVQTLTKALAILLGIMSAMVLARDGFNIVLQPDLNNIIGTYERWLDNGPDMDALLRDAFTRIGERHGIELQLLPHWRHPMLLMWLLFASYAWAMRYVHTLGAATFAWVSGLFCAFVGGALAGTVPLSNASILVWPLVSLAVFAGLQALYSVTFGGIRPDDQKGGSVLVNALGTVTADILLVLGGSAAVISLASMLGGN